MNSLQFMIMLVVLIVMGFLVRCNGPWGQVWPKDRTEIVEPIKEGELTKEELEAMVKFWPHPLPGSQPVDNMYIGVEAIEIAAGREPQSDPEPPGAPLPIQGDDPMPTIGGLK